MEYRVKLARVRAYLKISAKKDHPLHERISTSGGHRFKRGKSWVGRAADTVQLVGGVNTIDYGEEWIPMPPIYWNTFSTIIKFDKGCKGEGGGGISRR
uniref:Uncharacterized protein n=1 Tax=Arion vulgaris TaxID=1028688 RepID=A0A0B7BAF4_9EUPU